MKKSTALLFATACSASSLLAQNGDREGHVMTPPPAHWKIPAAPVVSSEAALDTFKMEDGFEIELVAAEPMVHDPVALAFDGNGRIWVAEMQGYMPDIDGKKENETYGRISVLEDTNGDGKADKHTVFLEKYLLPRAVALVDGDKSLLFADNDNLYEAEIKIDDEGNISAGEVTMVEAGYSDGGNPEHKSNGLLYSVDNWIYSAKCEGRYRKINGEWVKRKAVSQGQWGIAQDNYGRLLTNTNSNLVTLVEVPPGVTRRNPHYRFATGVQTKVEDQRVWPIRINPGVNRGYMNGILTKDGYLATPTAASGLALYRGDQFPEEYRGNLFVPEPAGNLVKRAILTEKEDGYREIKSALEGSEFLASTDERSRMVDAFTAPDGTLYLVDFYRGIIQHQIFMTSYLRAQVEERKLDTPIGLGRIYRVRHTQGKKPTAAPRMQQETSVELVAHLSHANGWWRDTAQRIIVERGDKSAVPALRKMAQTSDNHLARMHATWTLEGLGALDAEILAEVLQDSHPRVVAEAIRAAESLAKTEQSAAIFSLLEKQVDSDSLFVRRQLATSLGLFGKPSVPVLAKLVTGKGKDDSLTLDLAVSGLSWHEFALFRALPAGHPLRRPLVATLVSRNQKAEFNELLATLSDTREIWTFAKAVVNLRRASQAEALLSKLVHEETDKNIRKSIVGGMIAGGKSKKFKPMPVKQLASLDGVESVEGVSAESIQSLRKLFKIGSGKEKTFLVTEADQKQFEEGKLHYQRICLGCHQAHGNGQQYIAPPLVGSEWVLGSTNRLVAVVMDGVTGPIEVLGKTYTAPEIQPLMPGLRTNPEITDEQLAAILTYVRNAWGNAASPIKAKQVTKYRETTEARVPWPAAELKNVK